MPLVLCGGTAAPFSPVDQASSLALPVDQASSLALPVGQASSLALLGPRLTLSRLPLPLLLLCVVPETTPSASLGPAPRMPLGIIPFSVLGPLHLTQDASHPGSASPGELFRPPASGQLLPHPLHHCERPGTSSLLGAPRPRPPPLWSPHLGLLDPSLPTPLGELSGCSHCPGMWRTDR